MLDGNTTEQNKLIITADRRKVIKIELVSFIQSSNVTI